MVSGAIASAVSGLTASSNAISSIANNIANSETTGYKSKQTTFSSLVAGSVGGGVTSEERAFVDKQGLVQSTGRDTDLAISGKGFFAVQNDAGDVFFTRAGSFTIDNQGQMVNEAGLTLLAWRLNNDGLKPGDPGNADNTTPAESTDSLSVVDINSISGTAAATTTISMGMNLNAGQTTYQGATATIDLQSSSINADKGQNDIIEPTAGMQVGDTLTVKANNVSTTFTYGGFSTSYDVSNGLFGVTSATTTFLEGTQGNGSSLTDGDQFTITPSSGTAITFTFKKSNPDTNNGEFKDIATLQQAIDATSELHATLASDNSRLYVSAVDADTGLTFADVGGSNLDAELGFYNVATGSNRFNTLSGLAAIANEQEDIAATVTNPTTATTVDIYSVDPLQDLTVTKNSDQVNLSLRSIENYNKTDTDILVPSLGEGTTGTMIPGTSTIKLTDAGSNTGTFTYGGILYSDAVNTSNTVYSASGFTTDLGTTGTIVFTAGPTATPVAQYTVTYAATDTGASNNDFTSLNDLVTEINNDGTFKARVVNNRLYVTYPTSANQELHVTGTGGYTTVGTVLGGDIAAGVATGTSRFNTLSQLSSLVNASGTNITSTLTTGAGASILLTDGTTTGNDQITIGGTSNTALLQSLGLTSGAVGDAFIDELGLNTSSDPNALADTATSVTISQSYDPGSTSYNMASGSVSAQFSRNIQIYDSLGAGHDFRMAFLKTGVNQWAVELYAINSSDVITNNSDGLVASGTLTFNGDGSLQAVTGTIASDVTVNWAASVGAIDNTVSVNLGTAGTLGTGQTDGVRQFDSSYNVEFADQNGVSAGQFTGISIDENGYVSANFSNGEVKQIYQIPIVVIANPNLMKEASGNVYSTTQGSGDPNLKVVGIGGAGNIVPKALEGSNTDLAEELTRMIPTQTAYNASAKVITTAKELFDALNRI